MRLWVTNELQSALKSPSMGTRTYVGVSASVSALMSILFRACSAFHCLGNRHSSDRFWFWQLTMALLWPVLQVPPFCHPYSLHPWRTWLGKQFQWNQASSSECFVLLTASGSVLLVVAHVAFPAAVAPLPPLSPRLLRLSLPSSASPRLPLLP